MIDPDILTRALWPNNKFQRKHDRMPAQLTWQLVLHAYTCARAITFIEQYIYNKSGRCLTLSALFTAVPKVLKLTE